MSQKTMSSRAINLLPVASLLLLCCAVAGCGNSAPLVASTNHKPDRSSSASADLPAIGAFCTVQLRRDLLGAASDLPISPLVNGINGSEVSVSGRLLKVDAEWIVLEHRRQDRQSELWIPRGNVLLLSVHK